MNLFNRNHSGIRKLEHLVKTYANAGTFSGVVLVAQNDKILLRQAYGYANVELGVKLTPAHKFRIGSVAKTFTALAVMKLVEANEVKVTNTLATFLADYPKGSAITLHHLLSNTSGIPDPIIREDAATWCSRPHTLNQVIDIFKDEPLLFEPGSRLGYSNANWLLLAAVIEQVTGQRYAEALDELVLRPFQLNDTLVGITSKPIPDKAYGYTLEDKGVRVAAHIDLSVEVGAGGLYSTAADLYRLDKVLKTASGLSKETLERMRTPVKEANGVGYGYGFMTGERFGKPWWGHSGGTFGFSSFYTHYPAEDATVIVLSNLENGSAGKLEHSLAAALFGKPYDLPSEATFIDVAPETLRHYEGTYRSDFMGRPINFEVRLEDGLSVKFPLLPRAKLRALAANRFQGHLKGSEVIFEFFEDEVRIDWAGQEMVAPKR